MPNISILDLAYIVCCSCRAFLDAVLACYCCCDSHFVRRIKTLSERMMYFSVHVFGTYYVSGQQRKPWFLYVYSFSKVITIFNR